MQKRLKWWCEFWVSTGSSKHRYWINNLFKNYVQGENKKSKMYVPGWLSLKWLASSNYRLWHQVLPKRQLTEKSLCYINITGLCFQALIPWSCSMKQTLNCVIYEKYTCQSVTAHSEQKFDLYTWASRAVFIKIYCVFFLLNNGSVLQHKGNINLNCLVLVDLVP